MNHLLMFLGFLELLVGAQAIATCLASDAPLRNYVQPLAEFFAGSLAYIVGMFLILGH